MRRRRCRRFTILDGMAFVAAAALGLALARTIYRDALSIRFSPMWVSRPVTYFLLACSLAYLPLRLRRPRPPLRRLMCQPGMAACCAVALVTLIDGTSWGIYTATLDPKYRVEVLARYWRMNSHHLGPAVAITWLGLFLSRRWRAEPGWIDRLGRLLGSLWILTLPCDWRFGRWTFNLTYRWWMGWP